MNAVSERLQSLKKKQAQLKAQIQNLEAAEKTKERKRETRRKILIGAYCLDQANKNNTKEELYRNMIAYLTRETDKQLFE